MLGVKNHGFLIRYSTHGEKEEEVWEKGNKGYVYFNTKGGHVEKIAGGKTNTTPGSQGSGPSKNI